MTCGSCRTCTWWIPPNPIYPSDMGFGVCNLVNGCSTTSKRLYVHDSALAVYNDLDDYAALGGSTTLQTKPTFGCTLWEPKETQ